MLHNKTKTTNRVKRSRSRKLRVQCSFFFFQAEDGIRDYKVTGVQTCALPISHDRVDPSLVNTLNQQIQLLPDPLKQLFLFDPVGFIASGNLSPQLRALLQGIQPSNTQASLSAQFQIGKRISFSPTIGYYHQDQ